MGTHQLRLFFFYRFVFGGVILSLQIVKRLHNYITIVSYRAELTYLWHWLWQFCFWWRRDVVDEAKGDAQGVTSSKTQPLKPSAASFSSCYNAVCSITLLVLYVVCSIILLVLERCLQHHILFRWLQTKVSSFEIIRVFLWYGDLSSFPYMAFFIEIYSGGYPRVSVS